MRKRYIFALLALLFGLAVFLWPSSNEKRIRALLDEAIRLTQFNAAATPIKCRVKAKDLAALFAETIDFQYQYKDERYNRNVQQSQITDFATMACARIEHAESGVSRLEIRIESGNSAKADLFFAATWREQGDTEDFTAGEQLTLSFEKIDGEWKIIAVKNYPRS